MAGLTAGLLPVWATGPAGAAGEVRRGLLAGPAGAHPEGAHPEGARSEPVAAGLAEAARITAPSPLPHDIPADVVVRAFARAHDGSFWLVVRVPLVSMRDVEFPVRGPGYVDIEGASALIADQAALWLAGYVTLFEEDVRLARPVVTGARISLPSDPSFADYDRAVAHIASPPLPPTIDLVLEQAMLDVVMRTPATSHEARFSIDPEWAHLGLRTATVLRYVTPDGDERVFQFDGNPGRVRLDPRWHQALLRFVALGFAHILDGIDHLLFLLCLVIPLRRFWPLVAVVTAFTAAHSITLGASALGLAPNALWFPPLIEMLIAASIVFMALENIVGAVGKGGAGAQVGGAGAGGGGADAGGGGAGAGGGGPDVAAGRTAGGRAAGDRLPRRWMWAFGFGLVHGFGFSFQLRESLQFAGSHLYTSLLGFNIGVELGQLVALAVMVPVLALLFGRAGRARRARTERRTAGHSGRGGTGGRGRMDGRERPPP